MKNKLIINSTPIIGLSILGKLFLLADLFEKVYVPEAVYKEIIHSDSPNIYGRDELKRMIGDELFQLYRVNNSELVKKLYGKLHEGELEVVVGAKELDLKYVAIDEHAARSLAKTFQLQPIGTIGILILAKKNGLISEVRSSLDILVKHDFYISKNLYQKALTQADEL